MIPFSKPEVGDEEIEAVSEVMRRGWLAAGAETEAFEKEFAEYVGVRYAVFTNSCTSALKMAYKWAKENGCRRILYPPNTFCATYSAAFESELSVEPYRENYIFPVPTKRVCQWIEKVNVHFASIKDETPCLIEDSAHRIEPNDPLVGMIRCYSFYATKNMTTGSGGMFVTNEKEIYERARLYWKDGLTTSTADRLSGPVDYKVEAMAGGYDGNDLAAAMGRVQLRRLPAFTARRNELRERYNKAFGWDWMGTHLYCLDLGSEERVKSCRLFLWERGIGSGYHYPGTGWTSVSLPIYPGMTDMEQQAVIDAMKEGGYAG